VWCYRERDWAGRIRLGALAALAPVLWLLSDWAVTGDPFWSLNGTTDLAAELGRRTGLGAVPEVMPRRLGEIVRLEYLLAAVAGLAAGLAFVQLRRKVAIPLAIAVLNGVAFIVFGIAGLSLLGRYLFLASTMLALFAALAALGWAALPRKTKYRRRWAVGGALIIVAFLALTPWQADRLLDLRADISDRDRVAADLHEIAEQPAVKRAAQACKPIYVPNHRPVPDLALWFDVRPKDIESLPVDPSPDGIYIGPATAESERLSVLDPRDPKPLGARVPPPGDGPPNWERELGRNDSWVAFSAGCSG